VKLIPSDTVQCHDGNVYDISHRTSENYLVGLTGKSATQRLFKPDGSYAGSDKAKNVSKVL
jgi:hypothetical protein